MCFYPRPLSVLVGICCTQGAARPVMRQKMQRSGKLLMNSADTHPHYAEAWQPSLLSKLDAAMLLHAPDLPCYRQSTPGCGMQPCQAHACPLPCSWFTHVISTAKFSKHLQGHGA